MKIHEPLVPTEENFFGIKNLMLKNGVHNYEPFWAVKEEETRLKAKLYKDLTDEECLNIMFYDAAIFDTKFNPSKKVSFRVYKSEKSKIQVKEKIGMNLWVTKKNMILTWLSQLYLLTFISLNLNIKMIIILN